MAKNRKFNKQTTYKFSVNGIVSDDGTTITYVNDDGEDAVLTINECFCNFSGQLVSFLLTNKVDEDLLAAEE